MQIRQAELQYNELVIQRQEIFRTMGYGDHTPEAHFQEMLDHIICQTERICRPRILYAVCSGSVLSDNTIEVNSVRFRTGKIITESLVGADQFCLFIATAGGEFEDLRQGYKNTGDTLMEFIADSLGSVIAEACVDYIGSSLDSEFSLPRTNPYSPGYCGWLLTEQQLLFGILPPKPCGVELTESSLMYPIKSVSGVIGLGTNIELKPYGCAICRNMNCYKRRTTTQTTLKPTRR